MTDDKGTGKPCPHCGVPMINLMSINQRVCIGCHHEELWRLASGQKPLINTSRGDKKP